GGGDPRQRFERHLSPLWPARTVVRQDRAPRRLNSSRESLLGVVELQYCHADVRQFEPKEKAEISTERIISNKNAQHKRRTACDKNGRERVRGGDIRTSEDAPARPLVLRNRCNLHRPQVSVLGSAPDTAHVEQMVNNGGIRINS
ncbi:MAG: hypothetical protein ACXVI0_11005, partial [Halobacteriota archaeon]